MTINLTALQKQRRDTAANWTGANPTLLAGEIGIESDTNKIKIGTGSTAWTSLSYTTWSQISAYPIVNADVASAAAIAGTKISPNFGAQSVITTGSGLFGTATSLSTSYSGAGNFQVASNSATAIQAYAFNSTAVNYPATLELARARNTQASPAIVVNGDYMGEINFYGYNTNFQRGAVIYALVDGEPGTAGDTSDMPGKLIFATSANGSATPTIRLTIDSAGLVTIPGDLTVNGTTTTINSTTLVVQDKNIEMGAVTVPTDVTADGGGITLKGTTDKTINWIDSTDAWTFSEHVNIASAKEYRIAGTKVLDATSLGSAVVGSSLTSVGTISSGTWNGTAIADTYLATISTALKVSNSATTATSANTASAIVARDASGNFTAGTITAALTGTASGNLVSGGALGTPSSGTLTNCTFPTLNQSTTGNAATVTTNANLTGDVTSVGNATSIAAGVIVDADINASAAIVDTKLATISTAGKVSNSATTATDVNTASAIVARDASGNFTAGTITAALTGAASSNVLKAGDTMTGVLAVTAGTAALPAITPSGDPNTGIYSPGADQLAISTSGTQRATIDSSGRLLVNTTSSATDNIAGTGYANIVQILGAATGAGLKVGNTSDTARINIVRSANVGTDVELGTISFGSEANSVERARVSGFSETTGGSGGRGGNLRFYTAADASATPTERMRITNAGLVGLGTSSPDGKLTIQSSGNSTFVTNWKNSSGTNIGYFYQDGSGNGTFYVNDSAAAQKVLLNSNGVSYFTGGSLGIGNTGPSQKLHITDSSAAFTRYESGSFDGYVGQRSTGILEIAQAQAGNITFLNNGSERARIDSSGRLLVGTSTARTDYFNNTLTAMLQVEGINSSGAVDRACVSIVNNNNLTVNESPVLVLGRSNGSTVNSKTVVISGTRCGYISFQGADGSDLVEAASIAGEIDGTPGANDMPGRLVFSTTADGAASPTERMRITSGGLLLVGKQAESFSTPGFSAGTGGIVCARNDLPVLYVSRIADDGTLVSFYQGGTEEGTISVSGTTVSYNGAHLSRWSQLPGGATREEILRGTVLSNIDEMCGWGEEENEQLNRMKVSDVEGDKNVSGVFQAWDDDDDTYTDDFYCAMTGDFIIRIAEGVTIERGDLLMSAGDGTAKPQADDIIRSKTIAKVTSTHVTCTYEDGSYCVPCVLMAC